MARKKHKEEEEPEMFEDISVDGPYSPASLKKFLHNEAIRRTGWQEKAPEHPLALIPDEVGIAFDDPSVMVMQSEDRLHQANWFRDNICKPDWVPEYVFRYLGWMFGLVDLQKYPDDQTVKAALQSGMLDKNSISYKGVVNLVKYCEHNREAGQLVGFITLFRQFLIDMKDHPIKLLIDKPETDLHPQRTARFMSLYDKMYKEYGPKKK